MTESERALLILTAMHTRDALDGAGYTASAKTLAEAIKSAQPPAEPKPSASTLPQRLRANSYNAQTWPDCDVMREAAHALENKDAEISAVIRDNDKKMVEIEGLNERIKCLKDSDRLNNEAIDRKNRAADRMGDEIVAKDAEIERLKTELHSRYLVTQGAINARQEMEAEATRLMRENQALRNPDIEAAAKRLENIAVPITSFHRHFGASSHIGELTDVGRIAVARAILTREPG